MTQGLIKVLIVSFAKKITKEEHKQFSNENFTVHAFFLFCYAKL